MENTNSDNGLESYLRQEFTSLNNSVNKLRISSDNINKFYSAYQPQNRCKNRYRDILPNESSRVKLSALSEGDGDYINANYIDHNNNEHNTQQHMKGYILTQAPLSNTFDDFWRMVWLERVPIIICLTKMSEGGVTKGNRYWPEDNQVYAYGKISVLHRMTMSYQKINVRVFSIWMEEDTANARDLIHLQYEDWPDHGTPTQTKTIRSLVNLHSVLVEREGRVGGRVVVHCSAGVGRAGTYCAIHQIISRIEHTTTPTSSSSPYVDLTCHVKDTVRLMRSQREGTVQTPEQYIFIHRAIQERAGSGSGLLPVRSPLLGESRLISFPRGT
eukprot:TRINITY_DN6232_c0_g1_i2.p1 TRINITY_DN6232_c0_g1~~TRINITY_DN6232_c0_g1_i2.p1  ORF type:complete len:329 (-),score=39.87 TRINITY_DN6232_c0_g1_i2:9-995(-)